MQLEVRNLTKKFDDVVAVDNVGFQANQGEFLTLLGPSGCGKTTTLRCIAGLEKPDEGFIKIGDRVVFDSRAGTYVPPEQRGLGMVFQSYAIWPHMTVFDNVAYGLRTGGRSFSRTEIKRARTWASSWSFTFFSRVAASIRTLLAESVGLAFNLAVSRFCR